MAATIQNEAWQGAGEIMLTNDHPSYVGLFPRHPFDLAHGQWGAIGLIARYTIFHVDPLAFTDGFADSTKSVRQAAATAWGVNWYLNRAFRFQLDYERTFFQGGATKGNHEAENAVLSEVALFF